jgi:PIN domain nuclease of toxin-antitoxin system
MQLLLDTHLLLWAAGEPEKLSGECRALREDIDDEPIFSVTSLWEIVIENGLRRDFRADAASIRRGLVDNGFEELPVAAPHVVALEALPLIHKDPFDRILIAQAIVEGVMLLTADQMVARYPGPIRKL